MHVRHLGHGKLRLVSFNWEWGITSLAKNEYSASHMRFLGTQIHPCIWLFTRRSLASTLIIVMVYTCIGQIIRDRSLKWKHYIFNFPGGHEFSIAWRPSDRTFCISFPRYLVASHKKYQLQRLFIGCSCRVRVCSPPMVKLFGDTLPLLSDTFPLLVALKFILVDLIFFARLWSRQLVVLELRTRRVMSSNISVLRPGLPLARGRNP